MTITNRWKIHQTTISNLSLNRAKKFFTVQHFFREFNYQLNSVFLRSKMLVYIQYLRGWGGGGGEVNVNILGDINIHIYGNNR